jgi:hypothetical protein
VLFELLEGKEAKSTWAKGGGVIRGFGFFCCISRHCILSDLCLQDWGLGLAYVKFAVAFSFTCLG